MITIYGLKNCDTCRKALKWLNENDIAHAFTDIRTETPSKSQIGKWVDTVGLNTLLNKSSTTWRQLGDDVKDSITEKNGAALLAEHPTLIKRPVFIGGNKVVVGFKEAQMAEIKKM